jgi:hypothetical protein
VAAAAEVGTAVEAVASRRVEVGAEAVVVVEVEAAEAVASRPEAVASWPVVAVGAPEAVASWPVVVQAAALRCAVVHR